jgi:hypothetical protein
MPTAGVVYFCSVDRAAASGREAEAGQAPPGSKTAPVEPADSKPAGIAGTLIEGPETIDRAKKADAADQDDRIGTPAPTRRAEEDPAIGPGWLRDHYSAKRIDPLMQEDPANKGNPVRVPGWALILLAVALDVRFISQSPVPVAEFARIRAVAPEFWRIRLRGLAANLRNTHLVIGIFIGSVVAFAAYVASRTP